MLARHYFKTFGGKRLTVPLFKPKVGNHWATFYFVIDLSQGHQAFEEVRDCTAAVWEKQKNACNRSTCLR